MSSLVKPWLRPALLAASALALTLPSTVRAASPLRDLGVAPDTTAVRATVWLKRKDEIGFEAALRALQDPQSPQFRHWMTPTDYARYAPDQASLQTVMAALSAAGLTVTDVSSDRQRVAVSATVAEMSRVFQTPIHLFARDGTSIAAATASPRLAGAAGALVAAITGLSTDRATPFELPQRDPSTGEVIALPVATAGASATPSGSPINPYLTDNCYRGTASLDLETTDGYATFTGKTEVNGYFEPFADDGGVCGYDATQLRAKYDIASAYTNGLDGAGQTIGIVVAYGSPFILSDVNTYSQLEGLPQLGSSNFKIVTPLGATTTYDEDWSIETTLDVTMVHAIAPHAKIVLLVAPTNDTSDLITTFQYGYVHHLADTFSMSFGEPEIGTDGPNGDDASAWTLATAEASAFGIGVNVSSGDTGDNGVGTPLGAPNIPADSPYVTAVGGTTLGLPTAEGTRDVGWGWKSTIPNANSLVKSKLQVAADQTVGSGGGESAFNGKPYWQHALPGNGRLVPDISAIADPLTGADLVITVPDGNGFYQVVQVIGGTSAASPVFAGMSALANQLAGAPVGQIAPLLPSLGSAAITDILPLSIKEPKVTATINGVPLNLPAATPQALALLPATTPTIEQILITRPLFEDTIFTYGVDTSLAVTKGWDDVTGYGEPTGLPFFKAVAYDSGATQLTADEFSAATASP